MKLALPLSIFGTLNALAIVQQHLCELAINSSEDDMTSLIAALDEINQVNQLILDVAKSRKKEDMQDDAKRRSMKNKIRLAIDRLLDLSNSETFRSLSKEAVSILKLILGAGWSSFRD